MIVMGISGAVSHDPPAALFVDGEPVAAAEGERLHRDRHAKVRHPYEATRFGLDYAGIDAPNILYGSQLQYLMMEDIMICKQSTGAVTGQ